MDHMKNADALQMVLSAWQVCHVRNTDFLSNRSFSNLTELLGIGSHEGLNRMMRMSGVEEAYITGGASDYDKWDALCRVLPLWAGHPYVAALRCLLSQIFGLTEPLSEATPSAVWLQTAEFLRQGDISLLSVAAHFGVDATVAHLELSEWMKLPLSNVSSDADLRLYLPDPVKSLWCAEGISPLCQKTAANDMQTAVIRILDACAEKGCRGVTVNLSDFCEFVRPNPYVPAQNVVKLQKGECLTKDDMALIAFQFLRLLGGECVRRGWPMMLLNLSGKVAPALVPYLQGCGCFPKTAVTTDAMDEALLLGAVPYLSVDACETADALTRRMTDIATRIPIGRLGGLYMPLRGAIDLPLWQVAKTTARRCVMDFGGVGEV